MTCKSLPSPRIYVVDVPEVQGFEAEFKYNFFEKDERENDSGQTAPEFVRTRPAEGFDTDFIESKTFNRATSRYVSFTWHPVNGRNTSALKGNISIKDNLSKVHEEQDFLARHFASVDFNETHRDGLVKNLVRTQLKLQGIMDPERPTSPMELVKKLKNGSNQAMDPNLLAEAMSEDDGVIYIDKKNKKAIKTETLLKNISDVKNSVILNKKVIGDVLKSTQGTGHNIFHDEVSGLHKKADDMQKKQQRSMPSSVLSADDYDFEVVEFIDYKPVDPATARPRRQFVGYIIDKYEVADDGSETPMDSIVVENTIISSTIDVQVKYGGRYRYAIKSVVLIESLAEDVSGEGGQFVLLQYMVASKPSHEINLHCVEDTPPSHPADFDLKYFPGKDNMYLYWSFPFGNPQRDIKHFQVFRRTSLYEPFELLKSYDFNDSTIKAIDNYGEFPDPLLVEEVDSPRMNFIDPEFRKDKYYIYTVATVDAHGLTSNYGTQIGVYFNSSKNKLMKKLVSVAGAPKAYPNLTVEQDLFIDTMKTSQSKRLRVVFTPEYLKLIDSEQNDLGLLKTRERDYYKINMINLDLQEQQNIEIKIKDLRKPIETAEDKPLLITNKPLKFGLRRRV